MMKTTTIGNTEDIYKASKDRTSLNLYMKNMDNQNIKSIFLTDSFISKCTFNNSTFLGATFNNTKFISCVFNSSNLYGVKFESCEFTNCSFDNAKMHSVSFDANCKFIGKCSFNNVDLSSNNIMGIDSNNQNILAENSESIESLNELGFTKNPDMTYEIKEGNCILSIYFDTETMSGLYRSTIFVDGESIITFDLKNLTSLSSEILKHILESEIDTAISKISSDENIIGGEVAIENLNKINENLKAN